MLQRLCQDLVDVGGAAQVQPLDAVRLGDGVILLFSVQAGSVGFDPFCAGIRTTATATDAETFGGAGQLQEVDVLVGVGIGDEAVAGRCVMPAGDRLAGKQDEVVRIEPAVAAVVDEDGSLEELDRLRIDI